MTAPTPLGEGRLAEIRQRLSAATPGPWAPWLDQDGQPHMDNLLMVGNAEAVIPEGEWWVEDVDINPVAHVYTPQDREFIAHSPQDITYLLEEVERLRLQNTELREQVEQLKIIPEGSEWYVTAVRLPTGGVIPCRDSEPTNRLWAAQQEVATRRAISTLSDLDGDSIIVARRVVGPWEPIED